MTRTRTILYVLCYLGLIVGAIAATDLFLVIQIIPVYVSPTLNERNFGDFQVCMCLCLLLPASVKHAAVSRVMFPGSAEHKAHSYV